MAGSGGNMEKTLVAFDFDHTIIDDNSDLYIQRLAPNGEIPQDIKDKYSDQGWTEYMGAIFKLLHENGTSPEAMVSCIQEIQFVSGMPELLHYLSDPHYEVIIISDSNSVFINSILTHGGVNGCVNQVYTNPASFDDEGCLQIDYYHTQDWCPLSTVNMCKGHILQEHIKMAAAREVTFSSVCYVGDGSNDLCPALRLNNTDTVLPRRGYRLIKKIGRLPEGQLSATVVPWDTGFDVLRELQQVVPP